MTETDWKATLTATIDEMRHSPTIGEYELKRLQDIVHPPSKIALVEELTRRVAAHEIEAVYRVVSPTTGAGILEAQTVFEIPSEVYDTTTDQTFKVDPTRDLEVIYRSA